MTLYPIQRTLITPRTARSLVHSVSSSLMKKCGAVRAAALVCSFVASPLHGIAASSTWVHPGSDGRLVYQSTASGDRIMDFSHAGYMGGGVALPTVPVKITVHPTGGADDSAAIQAALDQVGAMPLVDGTRGAVLLAPGVFTCAKTLVLKQSGVVLRGSGREATGTTIRMTGDKHVAMVIGLERGGTPSGDAEDASPKAARPEKSRDLAATTFTASYVPAGVTSAAVAETKGFAVGDHVEIRPPVTAAWIERMHMHDLVRDGKKQTWIGVGRNLVMERRITAISGNELTFDVPLADSFDAQVLGTTPAVVAKVTPPSRVTQVGIEHLHVQCPPLEIAYGRAPYAAVRVGGDDCWLRDVYCEETMNATALVGSRITMQEVVVTHTYPNLGASKPSDFSIEGSQILIDRCFVQGDNEYPVWTSSMRAGPNVVLNSTFRGRGSYLQPHHRWSTGLLVDNCTVPDGGIDFLNRGVAGSGHGWPMGWGVIWNSIAGRYVVQTPPGVANWVIGSIGERVQFPRMFDTGPNLPEGTFESHGTPVTPQSLYLAQLAERLGPAAVKAIGYTANSAEMFPNKHVATLPAWPIEQDSQLGPDLAGHRPVGTSSVRGSTREFGGEKALDGDPRSYWATNDNEKGPAEFEVDFEGPIIAAAVVLEEAAGKEGQVKAFKVEGQVDSDWKLLGEGTSIGGHRVLTFPAVTVWKVRVTISEATPYATLRKFGLFGPLPK